MEQTARLDEVPAGRGVVARGCARRMLANLALSGAVLG
jgi:hypothetical protein